MLGPVQTTAQERDGPCPTVGYLRKRSPLHHGERVGGCLTGSDRPGWWRWLLPFGHRGSGSGRGRHAETSSMAVPYVR